ncbi:MAG TPA: hypothetical protein VJV22_03135 [Acidobacteriaceae bacterium]|nr:hypothetical protein [Acidobacteriaceae bacterium]
MKHRDRAAVLGCGQLGLGFVKDAITTGSEGEEFKPGRWIRGLVDPSEAISMSRNALIYCIGA